MVMKTDAARERGCARKSWQYDVEDVKVWPVPRRCTG